VSPTKVTFVLVHGAWHSGKQLEPVAALLRAKGHKAFTPTLKGNGLHDHKTTGLNEAIQSLEDFLIWNDLRDIVLVGHSYGGMIITAMADRACDRIRRLVYWNAFVPNDGESVNDMLPASYVATFASIAAQRGDGGVALPFSIWQQAFINDADPATAIRAYQSLNPHPIRTLSDKISLGTNPRQMRIPKSYINCADDLSLPQDHTWHPRLSQKLGLFRLIEIPGSHELCLSNAARLAQAILDAGKD
jgi:pimeloyl-ACP methyl ester carboxylesterase